MERWKINLAVLWFGTFLVMGGMTMIMPFLSLYLHQDLGVSGEHEIGVWAGAIFAANFLTSFLFQPVWGRVSDRVGRKVMLLRSGFGMSLTMVLMGFATEPWHLLVLRLLNGVISGYNPAAVALVSATTPKEKTGFAMGVLQSGGTAGTILGPFFGGLLADTLGFRPIFYITGSLLFLASVLSWWLVKETFDRKKAARMARTGLLRDFRELVRIPRLPVLLSVTFLIQFSLMSPQTLIPIYIYHLLGSTENLAFWSGFVGSVTGLSNMLCAPLLGRLGDRIGSAPVLIVSLAGSALLFVPQSFAGSVGELLAYRFLQGCFMGGLIPSVNTLLRHHTPEAMISRSFGFNNSAFSLGNLVGPVVGGALSGFIGIEGLFLLSAGLLLATSAWAWRVLPDARHRRQRDG